MSSSPHQSLSSSSSVLEKSPQAVEFHHAAHTRVEEHAVVKDIAAEYATAAGEPLTPEIDRRLLRKADFFVCTFMCWVYCLQFMDKIANSAGSVMGLQEDLRMHGKQYSWVGSSFYLAYLIFEIPMTLLLQRLPLARTTAVIIVLWGVVMACAGAAQNYAGFLTTRVLLGMLEGGITPTFMIITAQWYKRREQYSRTLIWFSFNGLGTILANAIGYGLAKRGSHVPIAGWRLLYVILGSLTVATGLIFYVHVPDHPAKAWFLTPQERAWQVERIRENKQGFGNTKFKWYQIREALLDVRTYLLIVIAFMIQVPNGGITNFQALLLKTMGYTSEQSLLMSMPSGACMLGGMTLTAFLSLYVFPNHRLVYASFGGGFSVVTAALLAWGKNNATQLAGLYLFSFSAPLNFIAMMSLIESNAAGHTKKFFQTAILLMAYCGGNLVGPQTFKTSEVSVRYITAKKTMVAALVVNFVFTLILWALNVWDNRRRDRNNEKLPADIQNPEFSDLTDFENPEFRYAL